MAISTVRARINGSWHSLTYNSGNGKWEASITAPGQTSYNQSGGYYNVTVEATNTAGTTGSANASSLDGLKLYVKETIKPTISIISPTSGAHVSNNKQPIIFKVQDEVNGSGVNKNSIQLKVDGTVISNEEIDFQYTAVGSQLSYYCTYTPTSALSDGLHTIQINASDNDGNNADQKSLSFTIDTVPPSLTVTSPDNDSIFNTSNINVIGYTNDAYSSPVTVTISLNDVDQGSVTVDSGGNFSKQITLIEGKNTIIITATDSAGKSSSTTRSVTLDTSVPVVTSATITPNPVDTGNTMIISVVIEEQ